MTATIINGRAVAKRINERTRQELAALNFAPGLGVVLVGDDPASRLYVELKEKTCRKLGLGFIRQELPSDATQDEVLNAVQALNDSELVHGIIVQLPLPDHLNTDEIIAAIEPDKDADGFHPDNAERIDIPPVLPQAVLELLLETTEELRNRRAVVLANSEIFFDQLSRVLETIGIECLMAAPNDLDAIRQADILVVAVGQPNLIRGEHIRPAEADKPGAVVVDIGTTQIDNKTVGDVDAQSVRKVAGWLTPVPGGVGPVTVAMLINNVVNLAAKNR